MLEISELQVSYGPTQVLFDVSISVAEGEMVSLLGRNGMGKSTIVKAVLGLVLSECGEHTLSQRDGIQTSELSDCESRYWPRA